MSGRGRTSTSWCALALPLLLAVQSWAADAHAAGTRVLLLEFGGRKADVLREQVVKSLEDAGHTVVLSEETSAGKSSAAIGKLAKRSNVDAVVDGIVRRQGMKRWIVTLRVRDADGGVKMGRDVKFQDTWLPGLAKELTESAATRLSKALSLALRKGPKRKGGAVEESEAEDDVSVAEERESPEPEAEPSAGEESAESDEEASEDASSDTSGIEDDQSSSGGGGKSGIAGGISARAGVVHRKFDFSDDIYDRLRKQDANIWVYQVQGEIFPFDLPVADRLGLIARYEGVLSGNVRDNDYGGNFAVVYDELFAGVRARYPLAEHQVGFDLTFGRMRAGLEDPRHVANIPEVTYTQLRSSLDVNFAFGPVHALASAAFRLPLGYGEVSEDEWFPRVGGYGVEATGGLEYPLSKRFSLEVSGSLRRYLLEMNSEPEDAALGVSEVAGGAVDLYTAAYLGMSFRL